MIMESYSASPPTTGQSRTSYSPLSEARTAYELLDRQEALKVLLLPPGEQETHASNSQWSTGA
jgi:hypothetical protein